MAFTFEKLFVYQKAVDFAENICALTESFPRGYLFRVSNSSSLRTLPPSTHKADTVVDLSHTFSGTSKTWDLTAAPTASQGNLCSEFLNGTFILSRVNHNACLWTFTNHNHNCHLHGSGFITYCSLFIQAASQQLYPSSNKGWRVSIGYGVTWCPGGFPPPTYSQNAIYQWNSGSSSAFDCTATRSLSLYSYVPDPVTDPCANLNSLTVTVN
jgi:hypothetical protein